MENLEDTLLGQYDDEIDDGLNDDGDLDEDALLGSENDDLPEENGFEVKDEDLDILDICEPLDDLETSEFDLQLDANVGEEETDRAFQESLTHGESNVKVEISSSEFSDANKSIIIKKDELPDQRRYANKPVFGQKKYHKDTSSNDEYKRAPYRYNKRKDDFRLKHYNIRRGTSFEKYPRRTYTGPKAPQKIHINPHFKSKLVPPDGWQEPFNFPHIFNETANTREYNYYDGNINPWASTCPPNTFQSPPPPITSFSHPPPPPHPPLNQPPPLVTDSPVLPSMPSYQYPNLSETRPSIPTHLPPPNYYGSNDQTYSALPATIYKSEPPPVLQPEAFNQLVSRPPPISNIEANYISKPPPPTPVSTGYQNHSGLCYSSSSTQSTSYMHTRMKEPRHRSDSNYHHKHWRNDRWKLKYSPKSFSVTSSNLTTIETVDLPKLEPKNDDERNVTCDEENDDNKFQHLTDDNSPENVPEKAPDEDEDEETKELRKKIEMQKQLRKEFLEKKEARRKAAAKVLQTKIDSGLVLPTTSQQGAGDGPVGNHINDSLNNMDSLDKIEQLSSVSNQTFVSWNNNSRKIDGCDIDIKSFNHPKNEDAPHPKRNSDFRPRGVSKYNNDVRGQYGRFSHRSDLINGPNLRFYNATTKNAMISNHPNQINRRDTMVKHFEKRNFKNWEFNENKDYNFYQYKRTDISGKSFGFNHAP